MNELRIKYLIPLAFFMPTTGFAINCDNLSAWQSDAIYLGGQEATASNNAYRAKWWTLNQNPLNNSSRYQVWTLLGSCDRDPDPQNLPPVANANGAYSAEVGSAVSFSSNGSTDSDGVIASYSWSFGDGAVSNQANPNHSYNNAGTYTVTLTVTDDDGASSTDSTAVNITDSDGDGTGSCAGLPTYVAGTSYAAGERVVNFDNSLGANVEFTCNIAGWCSSAAGWAYEPGNGLYWESAWTNSGDCLDGPAAPVANANGPYSAQVGEAVNFSSAGSNDPDGQIVSYSWNFGDGATSSLASPSHSYTNQGSYSVTLVVTDDSGQSSTDSATVLIADEVTPPTGDLLPHRALVGYWHNFINQAGYLPIADVSADWDIVNISFAENAPFGQLGEVAFVPDQESEASFLAGVQLLQSRGAKVLISLGGANAHITLDTLAEKDNFVRTMGDIIQRYGFDGMDIDLEGGSLNMDAGDTIANPQTPAIVNLIAATKELKARFGSSFILTMAPETAYVQGGYAIFGGIWGAYLPLIHALRDDLTLLHVQHYNTGSITAADDVTYQPATADFHVALSDMMITGFAAGRDINNFFPGLRSDQVAVGLPATAGAASSGQTTAAVAQQALDCLIKLQACGSYTPPQARTDFRGLMTWSINWDVFGGSSFSSPHRSYLDANP